LVRILWTPIIAFTNRGMDRGRNRSCYRRSNWWLDRRAHWSFYWSFHRSFDRSFDWRSNSRWFNRRSDRCFDGKLDRCFDRRSDMWFNRRSNRWLNRRSYWH
jgi:hypothetical protein